MSLTGRWTLGRNNMWQNILQFKANTFCNLVKYILTQTHIGGRRPAARWAWSVAGPWAGIISDRLPLSRQILPSDNCGRPKYISLYGQMFLAIWEMHLVIWTSTFSNLDKYILQFEQIYSAIGKISVRLPLSRQILPSDNCIGVLKTKIHFHFWTIDSCKLENTFHNLENTIYNLENTFCNLTKYILHFEQIHFAIGIFSERLALSRQILAWDNCIVVWRRVMGRQSNWTYQTPGF